VRVIAYALIGEKAVSCLYAVFVGIVTAFAGKGDELACVVACGFYVVSDYACLLVIGGLPVIGGVLGKDCRPYCGT
jgi:hypothetical protein